MTKRTDTLILGAYDELVHRHNHASAGTSEYGKNAVGKYNIHLHITIIHLYIHAHRLQINILVLQTA